MSTVVSPVRPAVSARFLFAAIGGILLIAALVVTLLSITSSSSSGSSGVGGQPSLHDNSNCQSVRYGFC